MVNRGERDGYALWVRTSIHDAMAIAIDRRTAPVSGDEAETRRADRSTPRRTITRLRVWEVAHLLRLPLSGALCGPLRAECPRWAKQARPGPAPRGAASHLIRVASCGRTIQVRTAQVASNQQT